MVIVLYNTLSSLVVPGRGCGIIKPYKKLDVTSIPDEIDNVEELECNTASSGKELTKVLAKVDEARCKNGDVGVCMHAKGKKSIFIIASRQ